MEFVVLLNKKASIKHGNSRFRSQESVINISERISMLLVESKKRLTFSKIDGKQYEFYIFGDLIDDKKSGYDLYELLKSAYINKSVYKLKGFFYLIAIDKLNQVSEVHSSFLNILPLYFYQDEDNLIISNSVSQLINETKIRVSFSKKYAIEKLLFYYSFDNSTMYNEIELVPSCSFIEIISNSFLIKRVYSISDYYVTNPVMWKRSLDHLSDVFINEFEKYLPHDKSIVSLTGGFDGRTVLAAALKYGFSPKTYSYGPPLGSDILIPEGIAEKHDFHHIPFVLSYKYAQESFWNDGIEFMKMSDFQGNISRAHYVYVARSLSGKFNYILTGIFGSEILRSMKTPGVMASPALFSLFRLENKNDFERYIRNSLPLKYLNRTLIDEYLEEILDNVWSYKQNLPRELSPNQKLYIYIFEEIFRKYFGPEVVMQLNYVTNRSPFIDFEFIKEVLKTRNAGAYSNLNETNPFLRYHGQTLYSHIIKKSYDKLLFNKLDKGYKPKDFLTNYGRIMILRGYLEKKIKYRNARRNPGYSDIYYLENLKKIYDSFKSSTIIDIDFYKEKLDNGGLIDDQINLINLLSLNLSCEIGL